MGEPIPLKEFVELWWDAHDEKHRIERIEREAALNSLIGRLEVMNEFRAQISNERGLYVDRRELTLLLEKVDRQGAQLSRMSGQIALLAAGIPIVSAVAATLVRMLT